MISKGSSCKDGLNISNLFTNSSISPVFRRGLYVSSLLFRRVPDNVITDSLASPLNNSSSFETVCRVSVVSLKSKKRTPP